MMFLLQLHENRPSVDRFKEVLDSLRSLEIPDDEVNRIGLQFLYTLRLPVECYGHSKEFIETVLDDIGIEVKWI